jgi:hypothetical protein
VGSNLVMRTSVRSFYVERWYVSLGVIILHQNPEC